MKGPPQETDESTSADQAESGGTAGQSSELAERVRKQETLRAFVESISSELEFRPLLDKILLHACELVVADSGSVGLVTRDQAGVRVESIRRMPLDEMGSEYGVGEGVAGLVLERGDTILLDPGEGTGQSQGSRAILCVPIHSSDAEMIGTLGVARGVGSQGSTKPFSGLERRTLEVFARHAAIAIENARRYLREQERGERLALIAKVGNLMTANVGLDEMLQRAADAMHDLLGYSTIGIGLLEPGEPPVLSIGAASGQRTYEFSKPYRLPITEGVVGAAVRERRTVHVEDVTKDSRYVPTPNAVGIKCVLALPILLGNEVLGVLDVESDEPFDDEDPGSLQIVADQLAVAIEAARLYEAGQDLAALQERQRLSRELHDSVTQHLFGTVMLAESLTEVWETDPDRGARRTGRLLELSRAALAEMRALLTELRETEAPTHLMAGVALGVQRVRALGLVPALQHLGEEVSNRGLPVSVEAGEFLSQSKALEQALYRIAQEALNNALKHSRATQTTVSLHVADGIVRLAVTDDGVGLPDGHDAPSAKRRTMGMESMRERAEALGGELKVRSRPDRGVEVEALVPLA